MLRRLQRLVSNSLRYLRKEGPVRFIARIGREIPYRLHRAYTWCRNECVGHFVELFGNTWKLDGLRFSLDDPSIATKLKSRFVWNTYERHERKLVRKYLPRELPVIEGGGSIGVIGCITNKLLKEPAQHLVVEANPRLQRILQKNRDSNGCTFEILPAAFDESGPTVTFYLHEKFVGGSVQRSTGDAVTVPAVTLKGLLAKKGWQKISLILDIEGAEVDLVRKEGDALRDHVALLIIELHPMISAPADITATVDALKNLGFSLRERSLNVYTYANDRLL